MFTHTLIQYISRVLLYLLSYLLTQMFSRGIEMEHWLIVWEVTLH